STVDNRLGRKPVLTEEFLAGLVVALSCIPSSISFAGIAGVNPLVGIWSCVVLGVVSSLLRGRPGLISGAAGVVVVPLAPLVASHGTQYMAAAVMLSAAMQAVFGALKLGRFISVISDPVMSGFLNGLGFLLGVSQVKIFSSLRGAELKAAGAIALFTASIIQFLPLLTTAVPSSLVAVGLATVISGILKLPVQTLVDLAGEETFRGGLSVLPSWTGLPGVPFSLATLKIIAPAAFSIAAISMLESLLAAKVVSEAPPICETAETNNDRVLYGNALGNAASALLGGFGGCGLIPQTVLNVQSRGRGQASSLAYALCLVPAVLVGAPLVGAIPTASLAGLMLAVAAGTVQWGASARAVRAALRPAPHRSATPWAARTAAAALLAASLACYFVDMASGIALGVALDR
ncbi:unnamed protein product, partial [Heterosigma akashiwo]